MIASPASDRWNVLVSGELTGGRFAVLEIRERTGTEPPRHVHSREDEFIYVLEGRLSFERDGQWIDRPAGTSVFLQRGTEHTYSVTSQKAKLLVVLSPAGLEACLEELEMPGDDCGPDQSIERLVATAARYGVTITGPHQPP